MKRGGNVKSGKKLARLLAVLVASGMALGAPNAVAFAEVNEISESSSGEKTDAASANAEKPAERGEAVSEEISDRGVNAPAKKAEEKTLEEAKAGYEALESFESVNPLEEVELNGKGTAEEPWLVESGEELVKAIDNAKGATYIQLTEDIDISYEFGIEIYRNNVEITLDLNGHTVHGTEVDSIFWIYSGKLTVEGSGGKIENTAYNGSIFNISGGELRLSGGTYSSEEGTAISSGDSTINVDAGTVVEGTTGIAIFDNSNVTVNGVVQGTGENGTLVAAVTIPGDGSVLTVGETGRITAADCNGIILYDCCSTVNVAPGATISSENSEAIHLNSKEGEMNITGGTITGQNGIVVLDGTLNIRGNDTEITGNGEDIKAPGSSEISSPSGAGVLLYKVWTDSINVTVEDAEITGQCAIYAVTDPDCAKDPADINVNLQGGKFTSKAETDVTEGKSLKVAFNLSGIKGATPKVSLTGGSYSGEDNGTYAEYYKGYCADDCDIEKVEGTEGIYYKVVDKTVKAAEAGGKEYSALQEAIDAAMDDDTVVLLRDIREDITVSKEISLDLNGNTITGNSGTYAIQVNSGNLTIKDGSEEKSGKLIATKGALAVGKDGIFVLDSGAVHADSFYGCYVSDGGKVVVNGGEILSAYAAIAGNNTTGDMDFEIHGGTLTAKEGPAIYMPGQGSLRMDGGTLNGGVSLRMGQIEISGGTINASSEVYKIGDIIAEGTLAGKPNYTVSGNVFLSDAIYALAGAYTSSNAEYGNSLSLKITGGTMNVANGAGTAVAVYDLGKETQDIRIEVTEGAVLSANTAHRHLVEISTLEEAGIANPESGYGVTKNKITEKVAEKFEHTYPSTATSVTKNATCTENGEEIFVCGVCGESKTESIPALGHNWVSDRCERCGAERNTGDDGKSGSGGARRSSSRDEILNVGGASPLLIPVPQQTAVPEPAAAPTPAAAQPAIFTPEPRPEAESAQLEDESVPPAAVRQEETKGREEPEKVINIGDEEVPMAAPGTSWAFLNLILMLMTAAGAIATVIGSVRRMGEEAEETGSTVWMIGLIPAICSAAMFVLTEKIGGSIVIADRWTVAMLLIALVEGAVVFFVYRMMNRAHNRA